MSEQMNEVVVETVESTPSEETVDYSQANQDFLDRFEVTFDKQPKKFETLDQLKEAAEMGSALPRYKEKLSNLENNAAHKYIDKYMKDAGYKDPDKFISDIKINDKTKELVEKGMSEEDARKTATDIIAKEVPVDESTKEIESFLKWHDSKVSEGKFEGALEADSIPEKVIDAYKQGQSLKEAYLDYMLDDIKEKTEQETIKKLASNKEKSAGKLVESREPQTLYTRKQVDNMSQADVNKNYDLIMKSMKSWK